MEQEPKHHVLYAHDLVVSVDAHWLRRYAQDFLAAAQSFEPPQSRFSPVLYFLVCRSIELSLKSFLSTVGFKKRDRETRVRHDLKIALSEAENKGLKAHLDITSDDRRIVSEAAELYKTKEFEYFESLETVYDPLNVDLVALIDFARRLVDATEQPARDVVAQGS